MGERWGKIPFFFKEKKMHCCKLFLKKEKNCKICRHEAQLRKLMEGTGRGNAQKGASEGDKPFDPHGC